MIKTGAGETQSEKFLCSRILNDGCKSTAWRNANYCFAVTAAIVLLNIILYAVYGSETGDFSIRPVWGNFSVNNLFQAFVNSYTHSNWQHVLLNMLCFLIAGIYLLQRRKRDITNIVAGAVMLGLIYFAMCFNGGTSSIGFEWYPYDLLHNLGHASGFVAGLVLGIVEQGTEWLCRGRRADRG